MRTSEPNSNASAKKLPGHAWRPSSQKSGGLVRERPAVIFAAIADWAENNEYPVDFMCTELEVSRSGYYAWRTRPVSHRDLTDIDLTRGSAGSTPPATATPVYDASGPAWQPKGSAAGLTGSGALCELLTCKDATRKHGSGLPSRARSPSAPPTSSAGTSPPPPPTSPGAATSPMSRHGPAGPTSRP